MKRFAFLGLVVLWGCGGGAEPAPEEQPGAPPSAPVAKPAEDRAAQLDAKTVELALADQDLKKIASERAQLADQPASEAKTTRLAELGRLEADTRQKKKSLTEDIAALERAPGAKPRTADEALDEALAADARARQEADQRRRRLEEEKKSQAEAAAAQAAKIEQMKKDQVKGGREEKRGPEAPIFEERWADVIAKVRAELQRFKR